MFLRNIEPPDVVQMETPYFSATLVSTYNSIRRHNPERYRLPSVCQGTEFRGRSQILPFSHFIVAIHDRLPIKIDTIIPLKATVINAPKTRQFLSHFVDLSDMHHRFGGVTANFCYFRLFS